MHQRTLFALAFLPPLAATLWILAALPPYIQLYAALAFELPLATAFLFHWYALLALLPWLFVAGWVMTKSPRPGGMVALALSLLLSALVLGFAYWAAHLPMMDMARRL